jgi:hypothetical protein
MRHLLFSYLAGVCVVLGLINVNAQEFNHPLTLAGGDSFLHVPKPENPDTLRILAIMVQFQEDTDVLTTGNGQFDLSASPAEVINPPPHNARYFEYHLEFARRYLERVSDGHVHIEYTVWENIFTLPEIMRNYSPPRGQDFANIGKLFEESWTLAAQEAPEIQFDRYNTFVIFHAGVGRDIDLVSLYGYDPSPYDIPSLYLGLDGLRRIFGEGYQGVPVGSDGFRITNTMILPETQSRELELITGTQLLQLGMNGLVCAMIGSRLGLPDLFNTDTGRSGIGRFGLMDGQAIFSFLGLFPPEPSAWEKYFLGWVEPMEAIPGVSRYDLPAVSLRRPDSILRVPINEREYYLVENRHRNPFGIGQTLTLIRNGEEVTLSVARDTEDFNAFNISAITGVVLDVSVYDWSLPGGVSADDIFYDGGILIWHIDERIIAERIGENRINADINRKGVRLVEADGSQDIGREYTIIDPGSGSEDGTALDFWFDGNPAPAYTNRFDSQSIPRAVSNTRAPVHIAMYDFGIRSPEMGLAVRVGSEEVSLIDGFPVRLESIPQNSSPVLFGNELLFIDQGYIKSIRYNGTITKSSGALIPQPNGIPVGYEFGGSRFIITRGAETMLLRFVTAGDDRETEILPDGIINIGEVLTAGPVLMSNNDIVVGSANGNIFRVSGNSVEQIGSLQGESVKELLVFGGTVWVAVGSRSSLSSEGRVWGFTNDIQSATGYSDGSTHTAVLIANHELYLIDVPGGESNSFPLSVHGESTWGNPIAVDLNRDGLTDILVTGGNNLYAFNTTGTMLDNFPVILNYSHTGTAYPVAADFDGDGLIDIAVSNLNDQIFFTDMRGTSVAGTPIAVGEQIVGSPVIFDYNGKTAIAFTTADNLLYAYELSGVFSAQTAVWNQARYDRTGSNVQTSRYQRQPVSEDFIPASRAYNWPNPVYDGTTYIRYFLGEDARVNVIIYEMNGEKVTEFSGPGIGGIDNEIVWNVGSVQSGVYLARIEAESPQKSEVRFIKIAVVK